MRISQVIICAFGIFMGVLAIVLLEINVSLGWVPLSHLFKPPKSQPALSSLALYHKHLWNTRTAVVRKEAKVH